MSLEEAFRRRVQKGDGCWLWQGGTRYYGYGVMAWNGGLRSAHRIAWELANGQTLQRSDVIAHTCDTPACCRPDHLVRTTQQQNLADMLRKGRGGRARNSRQRALTPEMVLEARRRVAGGESILSLSRAFGVKYATLRHAVCGNTWRDLSDAA